MYTFVLSISAYDLHYVDPFSNVLKCHVLCLYRGFINLRSPSASDLAFHTVNVAPSRGGSPIEIRRLLTKFSADFSYVSHTANGLESR